MSAAKATLDALEASVDVLEDQLDDLLVGNNKFVPWLQRGPAAVALVVGSSAAVGAGVSFLATRKFMVTKYEQIIQEETAKAREYYKVLYKGDELANPISALEKYSGEVEDLGYDAASKSMEVDVTSPAAVEDKVEKIEKATAVVQETAVKVNNIFSGSNNEKGADEWDYAEELSRRALRPDEPYIIHHDEYMENEPENNQDEQLTYFVNDDTLVDSRNDVIPDADYLVGDDNLMKFGHGSKDNNIVYVRNETLEQDFTIVKSEDSYSKVVFGMDDTLQHSDDHYGSRKRPRMSRYDEG